MSDELCSYPISAKFGDVRMCQITHDTQFVARQPSNAYMSVTYKYSMSMPTEKSFDDNYCWLSISSNQNKQRTTPVLTIPIQHPTAIIATVTHSSNTDTGQRLTRSQTQASNTCFRRATTNVPTNGIRM